MYIQPKWVEFIQIKWYIELTMILVLPRVTFSCRKCIHFHFIHHLFKVIRVEEINNLEWCFRGSWLSFFPFWE